MSDWCKTAKEVTAEHSKREAEKAEREALHGEIKAGLPANSMPAIIARIDAIERLLGLKPLKAEAGE